MPANDNGNQLHGGDDCYAFKMFETVNKTDDEVVFSYLSKDKEGGFPGNLRVNVRYRIDKNSLLWEYSGTCDEDTLYNMTNHTYFNLGDENTLNEYLFINTDKYSPVDDYSLTLDEVKDVNGTPYDFTVFTRIGDNLKDIKNIDNNYVWEIIEDKLMAQLKNDNLLLSVYSDLPDMHLYTADIMKTDTGKNGPYGNYAGVALECQYYPNGINYDGYIKPVLRKGERMTHYMRYVIENIKEQ